MAVAQDRRLEKSHFVNCGVPVAPFAVIASDADVEAVLKQADGASLLPGILKTARMGYDGKGQVRVRHPQELVEAFKLLGGVSCVLRSEDGIRDHCVTGVQTCAVF